jgi:hypothetical protein
MVSSLENLPEHAILVMDLETQFSSKSLSFYEGGYAKNNLTASSLA